MSKVASKPLAQIVKRPPGRPRSAATRQAIIDATIGLLDQVDYRDLSIERVAATAKVGKQSIYRWWQSKAEVVLDAYTEKLSRLPPVLPSGDMFADLDEDLARFFAFMRNPLVEKGVRSLIAEAQLDAEFRTKFYARIAQVRCDALRRILHRGVAMRQIRDDIDEEALAHLIHGAFYYRLLSGTRYRFDDAYAHSIVQILRDGIARPSREKATPS